MTADPTNPANSATSSSLLICRIETGNLEGIEELLQGVDAAGVRESVRALILAAKDEPKQALSALDQVMHEHPNDVTVNLTYGKIMAGIGSKEKAIEALTSLQTPISIHTRNLKLFEVMAKLATIAEDEDLAAKAQQNVDQLKDLELQFSAKLAEVVKTREGAQARIELGDLAAATGRFELARSMYLGATYVDDTLQGVVDAKIQTLFMSQPQLVPLGLGGNAAETVAPADPAPEAAPEVAPESTPEPDKANTPNSDGANPDGANPDDAVTPDKSAKDGTDVPDATTESAPK